MAIKITLRKKPISGNRESLYFDFYPAIPNPKTGKPTRREFLGMYVYAPIETKKNGTLVYNTDKQINIVYTNHNEGTLLLANEILQKKQNILSKPEIYSGYEKEQLKIKELGEKNFVEYFKKIAEKHNIESQDTWNATFVYLDKFTKGNITFADLNEAFCNDFKDYLLTTKSNKSEKVTLSKNSASTYFNKFKATIKQAYKDGYLKTDLNVKIDRIEEKETRRNFLTIEELNSLAKTDCAVPILKRASLFSALTGLRFSDIAKMIWSEIEYIEGNGYFINFEQEKTEGVEVMPISEQAYSLLGEPKAPGEKVFDSLKYSAHQNRYLTQWIKQAGITKRITFHCFRHTYATLQLSNGTDIYTVSKMLGHRDLKTTQIYAKIVDKTKRDATDKIKIDM